MTPPQLTARLAQLSSGIAARIDLVKRRAVALAALNHELDVLDKQLRRALDEIDKGRPIPHPDPPIPPGRHCFLCGGERSPIAEREQDAFCSSACATIWHDKLARRLNLFPTPRTLVASDDLLLVLSGRELRWITDVALPALNGKRKRASEDGGGDDA